MASFNDLPPPSSSSSSSMPPPDGVDFRTQLTAKDCLCIKLETSTKGYINDVDPFLPSMTEFILKGLANSSPKIPLIHRGTYARLRSVKMVVDHFLNTTDSSDSSSPVITKQILCLGSGYDTELWSLALDRPDVTLFEVDFPNIIQKKKEYIDAAPHKNCKLLNYKDADCPVKLIGRDLRESSDQLIEDLLKEGM